MNYATLKTFIAGELNRQDLAASIPIFIELAEAGLNRALRHRRMLERATNTSSDHFLALPDDFLQAKNIQLNTDPVTVLTYVTMEQADLLRSGKYSVPGQPRYYTIVGETIEFTPVPDIDYTTELTYYVKLETLSDTVLSNWLLAAYPDAYLYGALLHSAPYLKDDARIPIWDGIYQRTIEEINREGDRSEVSGATPRARTFVW